MKCWDTSTAGNSKPYIEECHYQKRSHIYFKYKFQEPPGTLRSIISLLYPTHRGRCPPWPHPKPYRKNPPTIPNIVITYRKHISSPSSPLGMASFHMADHFPRVTATGEQPTNPPQWFMFQHVEGVEQVNFCIRHHKNTAQSRLIGEYTFKVKNASNLSYRCESVQHFPVPGPANQLE